MYQRKWEEHQSVSSRSTSQHATGVERTCLEFFFSGCPFGGTAHYTLHSISESETDDVRLFYGGTTKVPASIVCIRVYIILAAVQIPTYVTEHRYPLLDNPSLLVVIERR